MLGNRTYVVWPAALVLAALLGCTSTASSSDSPGAVSAAPKSRGLSRDSGKWQTFRIDAQGFSIDYPPNAHQDTRGASTKFQFTESFDRDGSDVRVQARVLGVERGRR